MKETQDVLSKGKRGWIDEGDFVLCEDASDLFMSILEVDLSGLLDGSCEGILITYVDMTEKEIAEAGEFGGWELISGGGNCYERRTSGEG